VRQRWYCSTSTCRGGGQHHDRRAEEAGADLFLTKPFSPLDLLRLVHDELGDGAGDGEAI